MREILFRGKRVDNGTWAYGDLLHCDDEMEIDSESLGENGGYIIPETVGQYTGLCDRNRKKIFEGDIVNYNGSIHKVVFENRCYNARFGIVVEEKETWSFGMSVPPYLMEVIGNIHDNPELMGGNTHG